MKASHFISRSQVSDVPVRISGAERNVSIFTHHATPIPNPQSPITNHRSPITKHAFSLIEILVTVALLSFIILGLLMMFNQVQRAFRQSMTDQDVLSSGRAVVDIFTRDFEQMAPAQAAFTTNFFVDIPSPANTPALTFNNINFAEVNSGNNGTLLPLYQEMPGNSPRRTNYIQRCFLLTRSGQDWTGVGYQVAADAANSGVGTLYRYSLTKNVTVPGGISSLASQFLNTPITNCTRIADGIVHLRLVPYATNGFPLFYNGFNTNAAFRTNTGYFTGALVRNTTAGNSLAEQVDTYFMSNAVPAFVELELGILEPRTFERFKALGAANPAAQRLYLSNHVAQVHLFRQRIPVRNVDYSAYQ